VIEDKFCPIILHSLASSGYLDTIIKLAQLGLDLNLKCPKTGRTALHLATIHNQVSVVRYLTMMDCENVRDNDGKSAFEYSQSIKVREILSEKYKTKLVSSFHAEKDNEKKGRRSVRICKDINAVI
jgi:hypothetical protein